MKGFAVNNTNILIIDDEQQVVELIEIYLVNEGYQVFKAFNGRDGLKAVEDQQVQLVILDIMMPDIDGLEVCRKIRQNMNIPIIMLSAKSQDMDKILGLGIGADDYVVKPFNPMELIARIKSQLRRYLYFNTRPHFTDDNTIEIRGLAINQRNHSVSLFGKEIKLTPKEYAILLLLASKPGKVFSSEEIFAQVWQEKYLAGNNTVMVHIWRLREKMEENPKEPKLIVTVWGVGYKIDN